MSSENIIIKLFLEKSVRRFPVSATSTWSDILSLFFNGQILSHEQKSSLRFSYVDEEGDSVTIADESDWEECVRVHRLSSPSAASLPVVKLHYNNSQRGAGAVKISPSPASPSPSSSASSFGRPRVCRSPSTSSLSSVSSASSSSSSSTVVVTGAEGQGREVKIQSYNLANFNDHPRWSQRCKQIADLILSRMPDVVGLQEVRLDSRSTSSTSSSSSPSSSSSSSPSAPAKMKSLFFAYNPASAPASASASAPVSPVSSMFDDLMKYIGSAYPYSHFQPAMSYEQGQLIEGVAVLSRHPIVSVSHTQLHFEEGKGDQNTRVCVRARIQLPSSSSSSTPSSAASSNQFDFFVTHMTYDFDMQMAQARDLLAFMDQFELPQVLVGDFNVVYAKEEPLHFLVNQGNFHDVWPTVHPTSASSLGNTFKAWDFSPKERLDRIYFRSAPRVSPRISAISACVGGSGYGWEAKGVEVIGRGVCREDSPSDHLSVVATLLLTPTPAACGCCSGVSGGLRSARFCEAEEFDFSPASLTPISSPAVAECGDDKDDFWWRRGM